MANPTIQGTPSDVVFGVGSVVTAGLVGGRVTKCEIDPNTKLVELLDDNGIPTGQFNVPQKINAKISAEVQSDVTPAGVANTANYTVGGINFYLNKPAKQSWTRGGISEYELDLTTFP